MFVDEVWKTNGLFPLENPLLPKYPQHHRSDAGITFHTLLEKTGQCTCQSPLGLVQVWNPRGLGQLHFTLPACTWPFLPPCPTVSWELTVWLPRKNSTLKTFSEGSCRKRFRKPTNQPFRRGMLTLEKYTCLSGIRDSKTTRCQGHLNSSCKNESSRQLQVSGSDSSPERQKHSQTAKENIKWIHHGH